MKILKCGSCGQAMKKNGYTSSGKQRWRCFTCRVSRTVIYQTRRAYFTQFIDWLTSKTEQASMKGKGRTFRRHTSQFWQYWPIPRQAASPSDVVFCDGIYVKRRLVVLIARGREYVSGWYLARSENTYAWESLLQRIPPPIMVVSDGSNGFASAVNTVWPSTRIQRCLFHVHNQIIRCTTRKPQLQAGKELYALAERIARRMTASQAQQWVKDYNQWCQTWDEFLKQKTIINKKSEYTHKRLRKARRAINQLIREGTLFTYIELDPDNQGLYPHTNNMIEGGVNSQLRDMIRWHRGLPLSKQAKAIFWWCTLHSGKNIDLYEQLDTLPTDETITGFYAQAHEKYEDDKDMRLWGDQPVWEEFHTSARPY
ncbi:IS1249 family transposase [Alloscardovia macacae]|nr:IS1249 family transposase [Alloscardovia macacae]